MPFIDSFSDCLPSNITVKTKSTGIGAYGQTSHSTASTTYKGIVQQEQRLVRSFDGTEKVSNAHVIINATGTINPTDLITLPDGTNRKIIAINRWNDERADAFTEVFFG